MFEAPLDAWQPPFADSPLDRLYFIAPKWAKLQGGVQLTVDAPSDWPVSCITMSSPTPRSLNWS